MHVTGLKVMDLKSEKNAGKEVSCWCNTGVFPLPNVTLTLTL